MAVKWIGDAARELGIDVFDAVEILASKQNYPMNGLLDEDRVQLLKHGAKKGVDASGARPVPSPAAAPAPPSHPPGPKATGKVEAPPTKGKKDRDPEVTSVTAPIPTIKDRTEDKTVILPPRE